MLRKTVYDLIEQLVRPVEMQAIDILTEFAEFDERASDPGEIQQMLESLDKLFEVSVLGRRGGARRVYEGRRCPLPVLHVQSTRSPIR